jgi:hypothetical protein
LDLEPEFGISATLNRFLTGVLSVERYLLQMGMSLPVGGSLLLIAQRE